jgi:UDP-glucose 4-epimerase
MKKYLVTGGAGFIGSTLVRALLEQGDFVRVLDNFSTGKRENLAQVAHSPRFELIEGDIRNSQDAAEAVKEIDIIFHEAAFVSVPQSMEDPLPCFEINQRGTEILLEAARKAGVKRVVLASSAAVYGDLETMPLEEDFPLRPLSPYAVSKRVDELYAEMYTRSFGLDVVALRYFNVYGPRQRPDSMYAAAVPIFARRLLDGKPITIYGDGGQTRDLVYVGDVVRANLLASEHPEAPGQVFNVCTGDEIRVIDLVETLRRFFPNSAPPEFAPPRPGDIYRSLGNPAKAARILGFKAQTSLEDGLRAVVEQMKNAT